MRNLMVYILAVLLIFSVFMSLSSCDIKGYDITHYYIGQTENSQGADVILYFDGKNFLSDKGYSAYRYKKVTHLEPLSKYNNTKGSNLTHFELTNIFQIAIKERIKLAKPAIEE